MSTHAPNDPSGYKKEEPRRLLYSESRFTGAMTDDLYMRNSLATVLTATEAHVEQSGVGVVIAEKVHCTNTATLFLVAGEVEGEVRPMFSTGAAMIVAGAFLVGWALWGRVARSHRR